MQITNKPVITKLVQFWKNLHLKTLFRQTIGILKFDAATYRAVQNDPSVKAQILIVVIAFGFGLYAALNSYISGYLFQKFSPMSFEVEWYPFSDSVSAFYMSFFINLLSLLAAWKGWSALTHKISEKSGGEITEHTPSQITRFLAFAMVPFVFSVLLVSFKNLVRFLLSQHLVHFEFVQFLLFESAIYNMFAVCINILALINIFVYALVISIKATRLVFNLSARRAFVISLLSYGIIFCCVFGITYLLANLL